VFKVNVNKLKENTMKKLLLTAMAATTLFLVACGCPFGSDSCKDCESCKESKKCPADCKKECCKK